MRSTLDSFAVSRGQRQHCWLHLRGSTVAEADFSSAFVASGGRGHSFSGPSFVAATAATVVAARSQLARLMPAVSRWLP